MSTGQSSSGISKCDLCIRIYGAARDAFDNGLVRDVSSLSVGFLVEAAAAAFGVAVELLAGYATVVARAVISYIGTKGFSDPPVDACESMGFC